MCNKIIFLLTKSYIYIPIFFWFFILIFFVIFLNIFYKEYLSYRKEMFSIISEDFNSVKKMLNYIYIDNIWKEVFKLIITLIFSVGILFLLRFLNLKKSYNFWNFGSLNISQHFFLQIIFIISIILVFSFYFKFLNKILLDIFFKIYLYLYQYDYFKELFYKIWYNRANMTDVLSRKIGIIILLILESDKYNHLGERYDCKYDVIDSSYKFNIIKDYNIIYNYIHHKLFSLRENNKITKDFILNLQQYFFKIELFQRALNNYMPQIIVFIVFIYDLKNNEIKYIYFSLILFMIIKFYRLFRKFIGETDYHEIDNFLVLYYYKSKMHEKIMNSSDYLMPLKYAESNTIYDHYAIRIQNYFQRGFVVDYIDDVNYKISYQPYTTRFIIIVVLILYFMFCYNFQLVENIIITIPLMISFILFECYYKSNIFMKFVSYILIFISIINFIIIYLSRNTLKYITDTIDIKIYLLTQYFTIEEKTNYLNNYFNFLLNKNLILTKDQKEQILKVFENIDIKSYIDENTTIVQLKMFIENFIPFFIKLENIIYHNQQYYNWYYYEYIKPLLNLFEDINDINLVITDFCNYIYIEHFWKITLIFVALGFLKAYMKQPLDILLKLL